MTLAPPPSNLNAALNFLQQGHPEECVRQCLEILTHDSQNSSANHILALAYRAKGEMQTAEITIFTAVNLAPKNASILNSYGLILMEQGKLDKALIALSKAIQVDGSFAPAHTNLGHVQSRLNNTGDAERHYQMALALNPGLTDALVQLALLLRQQGRGSELADRLAAPDQDQNNDPGLLLVKGLVAYDRSLFSQAETLFRKGTQIAPNSALLWGNLALSLARQERDKDARVAYETAVRLDPNNAEVRTNFADLLKYEETELARQHLTHAISIKPNDANIWDILGFTWFLDNKPDAATECYRRALEIEPTFQRAEFHQSGVHFVTGELAKAWPLYAKRYAPPGDLDSPVDDSIPLWNASDEIGPHTVFWTDQGIGDEILQLSLVADAYAMSPEFTLFTSSRLAPIARRSYPKLTCLVKEDTTSNDDGASNFDAQSPAILLAAKFRKSFGDFPDHQGYLVADAEQTQEFREHYLKRSSGRPLIGLSWKSSNVRFGAHKSITLDHFKPILEDSRYAFIVLQYGDVERDIASLPPEIRERIFIDKTVDPLKNMDDFASQAAATDAILTTSNTTAHMGGALGIPTWTLVPKIGPGWLWYWFGDRVDSPWYPTVRLHRQSKEGAWSAAIASAYTEIHDHLSRKQSLTTN